MFYWIWVRLLICLNLYTDLIAFMNKNLSTLPSIKIVVWLIWCSWANLTACYHWKGWSCSPYFLPLPSHPKLVFCWVSKFNCLTKWLGKHASQCRQSQESVARENVIGKPLHRSGHIIKRKFLLCLLLKFLILKIKLQWFVVIPIKLSRAYDAIISLIAEVVDMRCSCEF